MGRPKKEESKNPELDNQLKELERKYGMKKASEIIIEPKIRTGLYAFDYVLSGGIAQCEGGYRLELSGREGSGKTTFAMRVVAKFQELDKSTMWINAENNYDKYWGEIQGINNDKLLMVKPNTLEQAGDCIIDSLGKVDLIVIDSITMLLPQEEYEADSLEKKAYASQAKVNSPFVRKMQQAYRDSKTVIIFINQMREKVGQLYGNPETVPGGRALKHCYDCRIELRLGKPIDVNKERVGYEINLKNTKNKKGKAFQTAVIDFYLTGDYDNRKSLLFAGLKYGVIELSGKTYTYKDIKAVGQEAFRDLLTDDILKDIEAEIWKIAK